VTDLNLKLKVHDKALLPSGAHQCIFQNEGSDSQYVVNLY